MVQIVDAHSLYAQSSILDDTILIASENAVGYMAGERVPIFPDISLNFMLRCLVYQSLSQISNRTRGSGMPD